MTTKESNTVKTAHNEKNKIKLGVISMPYFVGFESLPSNDLF
ncbi:hypothetical protein E9O_03023 [Moraxella catarrhalis 12P80B1]|nr:hypothetical protein E9O_03023 [Moraxella catarrhalis 12P80B1]